MGRNLYISPENVGPILPQEGKCCTTGEAYVTLNENKRKRKSQLNSLISHPCTRVAVNGANGENREKYMINSNKYYVDKYYAKA